ncbi:amino acid adenylation domain-containing protein [Micromonospora sp. NPDC051300]|uniref:amino acid adenylation domain-containing protein n=1 Tax=Micromonospora sp. NPDC051300 TaxID=3364286 RepID=UPI00379BC77D
MTQVLPPPVTAGLTAVQEGIWFTARATDTASAYHLVVTLTADGPLDDDALDLAWRAVTDAHPALRGAFPEVDGVAVRVEVAPGPIRRATVTTGTLADALTDEAGRPFDLSAGPLARCAALRVDDGREVVVVTAHHLVGDGHTKELIVRGLTAAYTSGNLPRTPPGAVDAAIAADHARVDAALPAAREFWRGRWREPSAVALPGGGRSGDGVATARTRHVAVDPTLDRALDAASATLGASRFELLLAAVSVLLARYGTSNVTIAVDVSTRTRDVERQAGAWVNELPIRCDIDLAASWSDTLAALRTGLREAYAHRVVPVGRVASVGTRAALAPVSVSYRQRGQGPAAAFGDRATTVDWLVAPPHLRSSLHVFAVDGPDGLRLSLQAPADGIDDDALARVGAHLRDVLAAAAAADLPVGDAPTLTTAERALLERINATARPLPADTVVDLFTDQVRRCPDAPALLFGARVLTYAQLDRLANRVAHGLLRRGTRPGDLIGLCARRGDELVVAVLGILKAGAAYLPLDPTYPLARLDFVVADAHAHLTLAHRGGPLPEPAVVPLDGLAAFDGEPENPPPPPPADALAYVIYTSGSTGRPKGVEVGHRALANLVAAMDRVTPTAPGDRWIALTSLSFDISALELFAPLTAGATLVIADDVTVRQGSALAALVDDADVTHLQATPSTWRMLLDAGLTAPRLTALCGGEALPLPLARRLREATGRLVNVYGPTETTIWSTWAEIGTDPTRVPIGAPLANTTVHVRDARLRPVAVGVPGELLIGGAGLAYGYRGRPELTGRRFVTDPITSARLYRTGDLVRLDADGMLDFVGRLDSQVKVRGHRIELGEVEAVLGAAPGVREAAVAVHGDGADAHLVAYLVGDAAHLPDVRRHLSQHLPRHMVPAAYVALGSLPLTPNGKLDRKALAPPAAEPGRHRDAPPAVPPHHPNPGGAGPGDVEHEVLDVWREVLRVDDIQVDDSLFDLGGHSLTITQITSRLRRRLGVAVAFDVFFDTPTVSGIAAEVRKLREAT